MTVVRSSNCCAASASRAGARRRRGSGREAGRSRTSGGAAARMATGQALHHRGRVDGRRPTAHDSGPDSSSATTSSQRSGSIRRVAAASKAAVRLAAHSSGRFDKCPESRRLTTHVLTSPSPPSDLQRLDGGLSGQKPRLRRGQWARKGQSSRRRAALHGRKQGNPPFSGQNSACDPPAAGGTGQRELAACN